LVKTKNKKQKTNKKTPGALLDQFLPYISEGVCYGEYHAPGRLITLYLKIQPRKESTPENIIWKRKSKKINL